MESLFWDCSQCVPINFSNGSQQVLNMFRVTPTFLSHMLWPKLNFHGDELLTGGVGVYASIGDCPMFPNWLIL
jgi:hypothetical protein